MIQYRFDSSYEKVYKYDKTKKAYIFYASYYETNIEKKDNFKIKVKKLQEYEEYQFFKSINIY